MKYEWRKEDKSIYFPSIKPEIIDLPKMNYFMLDGREIQTHPELILYNSAAFLIYYVLIIPIQNHH